MYDYYNSEGEDINPDETEELEFIFGSEEELKKLTRLICWITPELFEAKDEINICFRAGKGVDLDSCYFGPRPRGKKGKIVPDKARHLLDLVYEYNPFTGWCWQYNDETYDRSDRVIYVDVIKPSAHERVAAFAELLEWAEGKLPQEEIKDYFKDYFDA